MAPETCRLCILSQYSLWSETPRDLSGQTKLKKKKTAFFDLFIIVLSIYIYVHIYIYKDYVYKKKLGVLAIALDI